MIGTNIEAMGDHDINKPYWLAKATPHAADGTPATGVIAHMTQGYDIEAATPSEEQLAAIDDEQAKQITIAMATVERETQTELWAKWRVKESAERWFQPDTPSSRYQNTWEMAIDNQFKRRIQGSALMKRLIPTAYLESDDPILDVTSVVRSAEIRSVLTALRPGQDRCGTGLEHAIAVARYLGTSNRRPIIEIIVPERGKAKVGIDLDTVYGREIKRMYDSYRTFARTSADTPLPSLVEVVWLNEIIVDRD